VEPIDPGAVRPRLVHVGPACHHGDHDGQCVREREDAGERSAPGTDGPTVIRAIAAIDDKLGLSTDAGIPWHVQADIDYFRATTRAATVLMGSATYREFKAPMPDRVNCVATRSTAPLRDGFTPVGDVDAFLDGGIAGDLWVIGGASLFATTLHRMEELYLTRVEGDTPGPRGSGR
jgi:dihydrofolate reductase